MLREIEKGTTTRFEQVLRHAQRLVVLGDIPTLPKEACPLPPASGDSVFKLAVYNRMRADGNAHFLRSMREEPKYRAERFTVEDKIRRTIARPQYASRVRLVEVAPEFETKAPEFHLQVVEPTYGVLLYKDSNHLNADGADRLEQLFRVEIFGQTAC